MWVIVILEPEDEVSSRYRDYNKRRHETTVLGDRPQFDHSLPARKQCRHPSDNRAPLGIRAPHGRAIINCVGSLPTGVIPRHEAAAPRDNYSVNPYRNIRPHGWAFGRLAGDTAVIRPWTLAEKSSRSGLMARWAPYVCVRVIGQCSASFP